MDISDGSLTLLLFITLLQDPCVTLNQAEPDLNHITGKMMKKNHDV